jgi:hypothetical protein
MTPTPSALNEQLLWLKKNINAWPACSGGVDARVEHPSMNLLQHVPVRRIDN